MATIQAEREWLTVEQFRQRHGLSRHLVYESVKAKRLPSVKLGGKIFTA